MRFAHLQHQGCAGNWAASVLWKKDSEAPDYTPVSNASVEAAQIGAQLGREQMGQAQQQYDQSMAVAKPVVDAQLALMQQAKVQGDDYFDYMKSRQRPVEDALNAESMNTNPQDAADRALITGGDTGIYNARQGDIEDSVGRAIADARTGQSNTTARMIREGMRYGWSPDKLAAMAGSQGLGMASQQAAAANSTRLAGIDKARGLLTQNYDLRKAQEATAWGKKMDVAGLYRGLPGASQGAYSLALGAGNSATQNQMAPGNAMMAQRQNAMGTMMQGQGMQIQGLSSVLGSQTSIANQNNQNSGNTAGAILGLGAAMLSDRRVKENIVEIGRYQNGLPMYEFNYIGDAVRYRGVMAQDVKETFPEAIVETKDGIMAVNYAKLGLSMERVN